MALMNSNAMMNPNRMALLMSISEITPNLYLSGQIAATIEQVQKLGITYILNVAVESSPITYPKHIKFEKFDIIDFPTAPISNYFNILTDKIHNHINANKQNKVLVHCMAGISRSVTIVCAYLIRYMNMTLRDAYLLCKQQRPICFPNLGFWSQLIGYEHQLKKESSVKMISTQFGHVPDVALEEIKQMRTQQQQMQPSTSLPFSNSSFASTYNSPTINNSVTNDTLYVSSNQVRPTARDMPVTVTNVTPRSRSLAQNPTNRTTVVTTSPNPNNSIYQSQQIPINKPMNVSSPRYTVSRVNPSMNNSVPPGPTFSQSSFASTRSLAASTSSAVKQRNNNFQQPAIVNTTLSSPPATTNNEQNRSHYETTYRASFIKPLVP